jgi:hypothetical protein
MRAVLIAGALAALWLLSLWLKPFAACWRCGARGHCKSMWTGRRIVCPRCDGLRRRQRTGSRLLHRIVRDIRQERQRQREERQR